MKIKVVQYLIGNDENYVKLSNLSEKFNKKYCEINNYEYKFEYIKDEIKLDFNTKTFYKLHCINNNLNDCDYLVFIEYDAVVSNPTKKIEDLIDNNYELFLSRGNDKVYQIISIQNLYKKLTNLLLNNQKLLINNYFYEFIDKLDLYSDLERLSLGNIFFNEGLYIVKNTNNMKEFFSLCLQFGQYFLNRIHQGMFADAAVMCFFLQQKKFNNLYTFLPNYSQGCYASSFENKYNEDITFILHNYGNFDIKTKYDLILKLKENKYWKNINV